LNDEAERRFNSGKEKRAPESIASARHHQNAEIVRGGIGFCDRLEFELFLLKLRGWP